MIDDIVKPRTRAELEERLVGASPHLAEIIRAALEAGPDTDEWRAAQFELGVD